MTYLNGNDLPEYANRVVSDVVNNHSTARITVNGGTAIVMSKEQYEELMESASGDWTPRKRSFNVEPELEMLYREEVDF